MSQQLSLAGFVLMIIASLTAGNAAIVIAARPTLLECVPDYLQSYVDVMFATLLVSAMIQFVMAATMCVKGLPEVRQMIELQVVPEITTVAKQIGHRWRIPWNRLPLFNRTPLNQERLPPDVSMERMELPPGGYA